MTVCPFFGLRLPQSRSFPHVLGKKRLAALGCSGWAIWVRRGACQSGSSGGSTGSPSCVRPGVMSIGSGALDCHAPRKSHRRSRADFAGLPGLDAASQAAISPAIRKRQCAVRKRANAVLEALATARGREQDRRAHEALDQRLEGARSMKAPASAVPRNGQPFQEHEGEQAMGLLPALLQEGCHVRRPAAYLGRQVGPGRAESRNGSPRVRAARPVAPPAARRASRDLGNEGCESRRDYPATGYRILVAGGFRRRGSLAHARSLVGGQPAWIPARPARMCDGPRR